MLRIWLKNIQIKVNFTAQNEGRFTSMIWVYGPTLPMVISLISHVISRWFINGRWREYLVRLKLSWADSPRKADKVSADGAGCLWERFLSGCQGGRRAVHLWDWSLRERPSTVSNFWVIHWRLRKWFWPHSILASAREKPKGLFIWV